MLRRDALPLAAGRLGAALALRRLHLDCVPADFHAGPQLADVKGFGEIVVRPSLEGGDDVGLLDLGAEHDQIGRTIGLHGTDTEQHLQPVHFRHDPIKNSQRGRLGLPQHIPRLSAIDSFLHLITTLF